MISGRVTDIVTHIDAETKQYVHYEYDNAGNITKCTPVCRPYSTSLTADDYHHAVHLQRARHCYPNRRARSERDLHLRQQRVSADLDRPERQPDPPYLQRFGAVVTDAVYSGQTPLTEKTSTYTKTGAPLGVRGWRDDDLCLRRRAQHQRQRNRRVPRNTNTTASATPRFQADRRWRREVDRRV